MRKNRTCIELSDIAYSSRSPPDDIKKTILKKTILKKNNIKKKKERENINVHHSRSALSRN